MNQTNENKPSENGMDAKDSRRKFVTGSLAVSLLTVLPNKRVWGTTNACTASGNMSGNVSNANQVNCSVSGFGPNRWKLLKERQNSRVDLNVYHSTWGQIFGNNAPFGHKGSTSTPIYKFIGVNTNTDYSGPNGINAHLVAAFLNAHHNLYPLASNVSPSQYVQGLYREAMQPAQRDKLIVAIQDTYR